LAVWQLEYIHDLLQQEGEQVTTVLTAAHALFANLPSLPGGVKWDRLAKVQWEKLAFQDRSPNTDGSNSAHERIARRLLEIFDASKAITEPSSPQLSEHAVSGFRESLLCFTKTLTSAWKETLARELYEATSLVDKAKTLLGLEDRVEPEACRRCNCRTEVKKTITKLLPLKSSCRIDISIIRDLKCLSPECKEKRKHISTTRFTGPHDFQLP